MERAIRTDERSGVLQPEDLERFRARWFELDAAVTKVVESLWSVRWRFDPGEPIRQRIIATPGITLTIESGDAPGRRRHPCRDPGPRPPTVRPALADRDRDDAARLVSCAVNCLDKL